MPIKLVGALLIILIGAYLLLYRLQKQKIVIVPCLPIAQCPFGGRCFDKGCLFKDNNGSYCSYCENGTSKCVIGESYPLALICPKD